MNSNNWNKQNITVHKNQNPQENPTTQPSKHNTDNKKYKLRRTGLFIQWTPDMFHKVEKYMYNNKTRTCGNYEKAFGVARNKDEMNATINKVINKIEESKMKWTNEKKTNKTFSKYPKNSINRFYKEKYFDSESEYEDSEDYYGITEDDIALNMMFWDKEDRDYDLIDRYVQRHYGD